MKINKLTCTIILIGVGLIILISGYLLITLRESRANYAKIINDSAFREFNNTIISLKNLDNIAILPDENFIVINGFVINTRNKTFGKEPILGFYESYYENASETKYESLTKLLDEVTPGFKEGEIMFILTSMKKYRFADTRRTTDDSGRIQIMYRGKVSATWGEEGIIYSEISVDMNNINFKKIEKFGDNFYYFIK